MMRLRNLIAMRFLTFFLPLFLILLASVSARADGELFLVIMVQPDEGALGGKSALREDSVAGIGKGMQRMSPSAIAVDGGSAAKPNPVPRDLADMAKGASSSPSHVLGVTTRLLLFQDQEKTVIQIRMLGDLIDAKSGERIGEPLEEKVNYKGPLPCDRACQFENTKKSIPHIASRLAIRLMSMARAMGK
jgi:hypothetical protein